MSNAVDHAAIFDPLRRPSRDRQPKYVRLADALINAITSGHWKPGDKLPTEEELAEMTPFSLGTVQRALRGLSEQGIVVRQHGVGSFVAETQMRVEDPWHCRFLDDDGESYLPIYSRAIKREFVTGRGNWSDHFPQPSEHVFRIDRVLDINNEFNVFTHFYADRRLLPALWEDPLSKLSGINFKRLIARESNVPITQVSHLVRAMKFDDEVVAMLNLESPLVGLFLQAAAYMGREACVYYQEFFIPPTRRPLSIPSEPNYGYR
jgi:DNA-binding GntR family transcriptional regulator